MKKAICLALTLALIITASFCFSITAYADVPTDDIELTRLGDSDTYYQYDYNNKILTISGTGETPNFTDSATSLPWYSWRSSDYIQKVVIEEGITSIGKYMLCQVKAKEIVLPQSLTKISSYALAYTTGVTNWDLPFRLKTIDAYAFYSCSTATNFDIKKNVTSIGKMAFYNCSSLQSIVLPYSVKTIGSSAFYNCTQLSNVTFQSLTSDVSLSSSVFTGCASLKELTVPMNSSVGSSFYGYKSSKTKYDDVKLYVYSGSSTHVYADANGIDYEIIDTINMSCGVYYNGSYDDNNVTDKYTFLFSPNDSEDYVFYSTGSCDLTATLVDSNGNEIASSDDISNENRNFCITSSLDFGEQYSLIVSSYKSTGDFTIYAYPNNVEEFTCDASILLNGSDGVLKEDYYYFDIQPKLLDDSIVNVKFADGFCDTIFFTDDMYAYKYLTIVDNQQSCHYTCGHNNGQLQLDCKLATFDINISHCYSVTTVEPTLYDDGYDLYQCYVCKENYKTNFVETTAVTVSGTAVLAENTDMEHPNNIPYTNIYFESNGETYYTDSNGNFSFNTFDSCDITFVNKCGDDVTFHIDVDGENVNIGDVAFVGFDFNNDSFVNAKDFAIFYNNIMKSDSDLNVDYNGDGVVDLQDWYLAKPMFFYNYK